MEKVLVSACLLGEPVRWDGRGAALRSDALARWEREGRIVPFCPETAGGLPIPRPPAEIVGGSGADVLAGRAAVRTREGEEVTAPFLLGAEAALRRARLEGIRVAVLKERSPSCGSHRIYDGSFSGMRVGGEGVTAALLRQAGVRVFSEEQIVEADELLALLDRGA